MYEKINRNSLILSGITTALLLGIIIYLFVFQLEFLKNNLILVFVVFIVLSFLSFYVVRYYEYHADKKIILKALENNQVALLKIDRGTYYKSIKDSLLKKYNFWKIEGTLYEQDLNVKKISVINKFNVHQTSIPTGYVYVINDGVNDNVIVQNELISSYYNLKDIVENYEKKVKNLKYLNVFYQNGLGILTFKESLRSQSEEEK